VKSSVFCTPATPAMAVRVAAIHRYPSTGPAAPLRSEACLVAIR